jgi:4-hydroxy-3-methylbut-2-enyl diphosphate reductase IspH
MPQGGSFPVSDWMKEGIETRTERVKRLERERVLDEVWVRVKAEFMAAGVGASAPLRRVERIIKELREGEE